MPDWEITTLPPIHTECHGEAILTLDGGLQLRITDEYMARVVLSWLPRECRFPSDMPLEECLPLIPARVLPVLRSAVADLERMINGPKVEE